MLTIDQDFVYVMTNYNDKDKLKELNGTWFKGKGWRFPKNVWVMRELEHYIPQLKNNVQFIQTKTNMEASLLNLLNHKNKSIELNPKLRPYQNSDLHYLMQIKSAGIFNEPRTGKTPMTIELIRQTGSNKNIIITPASLIWNWHKEFKQWYPEHEVTVIHQTKAKRQEIYKNFTQGTMVISKDTLKSDLANIVGIQFSFCAVDEAHFLRNYKTAQSEAICKINSERKYALTGTPTVKHASDIYGIFKFLYPKKYPSYWQFVERYFYVHDGFFGKDIGNVKAKRKDELQELTGMMSVQRMRKEVMQWLPDKIHVDIPVLMKGKQEKLYRQLTDEFFAEDDNGTVIDTSNVLAQLMRLRQICLDPRLIGFDVVGEKTNAILEYLDYNREPIVIMSMFTSYLQMIKEDIEKLGLKVGMIHGQMSNEEKHQSAMQFQNGKLDVLLCNIISAGTGFTLDRASTIVFTDKAWNPSDNQQAEDRITPTVKERNHSHNIITFECIDSVDERINKILKDKKSITDIINEGGKQAIQRLIKGRL